MIKVLVTGASGQLGSALKLLGTQFADIDLIFVDRTNFNICDFEKTEKTFAALKPDLLIHTAAYTAVDQAESDQQNCFDTNANAVGHLARCCNRADIPLIHISTDFVFDGCQSYPYKEFDIPNPTSVYGASKLEGERQIAAATEKYVILRTSWLYSEYGKNFVKTILNHAARKAELSVVFDQVGTPTYAVDLARAVLTILPKVSSKTYGLYHYSNEGVCSWYDFARVIVQDAGLDCRIMPIETHQYPTPAKRPHYSVLNKLKFKESFGLEIPYWRDSLHTCVLNLSQTGNA